MVVILVGASSTGKSSISDALFSNFAYERVISFMTEDLVRERRTDSIMYSLMRLNSKTRLPAEMSWNTKSIPRTDSTDRPDISISGDEDKVAILTPHGVRSLKKKRPELRFVRCVYQSSSKRKSNSIH